MAHDEAFKHVVAAAEYLEMAAKWVRGVSAGVANGTHGVGAILGLQHGLLTYSAEAVRELGTASIVYDSKDGPGAPSGSAKPAPDF